jgi:hypothetical protein
MKQQKYLQTAFDKALFNTYSNRQRRDKAKIGGIINWRTGGAILCASLLLALFGWTNWQAVKADSSIGNIPTGSDPFSVAVNPVTNKIYVANFNGDTASALRQRVIISKIRPGFYQLRKI